MASGSFVTLTELRCKEIAGAGKLTLVAVSSDHWKMGVLIGVCLTVIGVGAGYIDVATHFRFFFF